MTHRRPRSYTGLAAVATVWALACVACGGIESGQPASSAAPPPTATPPPSSVAELHQGIDVSSHSGAVDWRAVAAAGHTFAFIKASEGVDLPDPDFAVNWRAAMEAGLIRGAYHFYVTEDDPEAQARLFTGTVDLAPGDMAPVVDVELIGHGTRPGLADRLRTFLRLLEDHYGVRAIIYTSPKFWNAHLDDSFGRHPLWVAEYGVDQPTLPAGWDRWHLWQWQGDALVAGVEKEADLSRVNRAADDLHRLLVPRPARGPTSGS